MERRGSRAGASFSLWADKMIQGTEAPLECRGGAAGKTIFVLFLLMTAGGGFLFLSAPWADVSYPLDDAWIHMVYARNLVQGEGLSYNPPQPEAGFSSPLWLIVMAGAQLAGEGVMAPKLAGLVFLFLLAWVARRLGGDMAGLIILLDPLLYFSALSGMEVTLFAFLFLLSIERWIKEKPGLAGLAAAGALLARPEGALLCLLLPIFDLFMKNRFAKRLERFALLTIPSLMAAGLWIFFCLHTTGRPFPNPFYVKAGFMFGHEGQLLLPVISRLFYDLYALMADAGLLYPVLAGGLGIIACFGLRIRSAWIVLLLSAGLFTGTWLSRPVLRIHAFYWERYFIPVLVGSHILAGMAVQGLWRSHSRALRSLAVLAGMAVAGVLCLNMQPVCERYGLNCRDIARFNVAAGRWIQENTPLDSLVAVQDAGAIKYYGKRTTIDLGGLNNQDLVDLTPLSNRVDISDPLAVALFEGADWAVVFQRHFSGNPSYEVKKVLTYDDYSIYVTPEKFTLLILKKITQKD
ncbi:MAG: hypothetical protein ABIK28_24690 [Planctomycetota bacterium]